MRAVPARASQATFEERWTLGRGLQVRSVAGPSSVCVRARALSGGSGGGPQCLVRVHCSRSWRTSCASTPSSSSASSLDLNPILYGGRSKGLVDPPWRGTGPSVGPSPLNRTAAKAAGRSVGLWHSERIDRPRTAESSLALLLWERNHGAGTAWRSTCTASW